MHCYNCLGRISWRIMAGKNRMGKHVNVATGRRTVGAHRAKPAREPYGWLGAGVVVLGVGIATDGRDWCRPCGRRRVGLDVSQQRFRRFRVIRSGPNSSSDSSTTGDKRATTSSSSSSDKPEKKTSTKKPWTKKPSTSSPADSPKDETPPSGPSAANDNAENGAAATPTVRKKSPSTPRVGHETVSATTVSATSVADVPAQHPTSTPARLRNRLPSPRPRLQPNPARTGRHNHTGAGRGDRRPGNRPVCRTDLGRTRFRRRWHHCSVRVPVTCPLRRRRCGCWRQPRVTNSEAAVRR